MLSKLKFEGQGWEQGTPYNSFPANNNKFGLSLRQNELIDAIDYILTLTNTTHDQTSVTWIQNQNPSNFVTPNIGTPPNQ